MKKENFSIIFSSLTGNTKKLADTIHEMLPHDKCDYFGENDSRVPQSDLLYIGFWTDKGNADHKTLELLAKLKNKKIFLFGTAGFGGSDVYFKKILEQVRQCPKQGIPILCGGREYVWDFLRWYLYEYAEQILLMFVKQIFEDFENLENKKESNLNKTCCCRPAVNSYNESGQIYLYNSIARA